MTDLEDGTFTAVVDTVEDGLATVFFEANGNEEGSAVVNANKLPEAGRHADAILSVTVTDGSVVEWQYDEQATAERTEAAQNRFDRLSKRPPSRDEP